MVLVIHYASDDQQDFFEIFNLENQREYYSNRDYQRVGGRKGDLDTTLDLLDDTPSQAADDDEIFNNEAKDNDAQENRENRPKIFSKKRKEGQVTSRIGDLLT